MIKIINEDFNKFLISNGKNSKKRSFKFLNFLIKINVEIRLKGKFMTFFTKNQLAQWGESLAKEYLQENGFFISECNFRTASGEIDLIVTKDDRYIFVEVKTRQSINYGFPEEAVDFKKLDHIENVVWDYFELNNIQECDWQIDVISILRNPSTNKYEIEWFENVLE